MAKEKIVAHEVLEKHVRIREQLDVETIVPLDEKITPLNPLTYMLEHTGYLHFITDMPVFKYEIEKEAEFPADFTAVLTLTDPKGGAHVGRFEKIAIEPANLRIVGTRDEEYLKKPPTDIWTK